MATLESGLDRIQAIRHTKKRPDAYIKQRIATAAEELSRAGDVALCCEIANEVLASTVNLLYQTDIDGEWSNLDNRNSKVLVPLAWCSSGWKVWGIREWEKDVLNRILRERSTKRQPRPALFLYSSDSRTWSVNTGPYDHVGIAQVFLQLEPVRLEDWRRHYAAWCDAGVQRAQRSRARSRG